MKKLMLALVCGLLLTACAPADTGSGSVSAVQPAPGVPAQVEMHEGMYDDEKTYGCRPEFIQDDKYVQPDYYGVEVKNVTEISFDFTLYLYQGEDEKRPSEVTSGTAYFVEDGKKAVCEELTFVFPNEWNSLPTVVDFRIQGFEPAAEVLFVNNDIPGYQFS